MNKRRRLLGQNNIDLNLSGHKNGDIIYVSAAAGNLTLNIKNKDEQITDGNGNVSISYYNNQQNNQFFNSCTLNNQSNIIYVRYNPNYSTSNQNGGHLEVTYKNTTITIYIIQEVDEIDYERIYVTGTPIFVPDNNYGRWNSRENMNRSIKYSSESITILSAVPTILIFNDSYVMYNSGNLQNNGRIAIYLETHTSYNNVHSITLKNYRFLISDIYQYDLGNTPSSGSVYYGGENINVVDPTKLQYVEDINDYYSLQYPENFGVNMVCKLDEENQEVIAGNTYNISIYLQDNHTSKYWTTNSIQYSIYINNCNLSSSNNKYINYNVNLLSPL